jgi:hypothetical protein
LTPLGPGPNICRVPTPRLAAAAALTVLAVVLTGCSSGGGGTSSAAGPAGATSSAAAGSDSAAASSAASSAAGGENDAAPDPCSLVTAAELSSAYGVSFAAGTPSTDATANQNAGLRACKYDDTGGIGSFLLQTTSSQALGSSVSDFFDQSKDLYPDATDGGAGDTSILLADDAGFLAVKGDVFVQGNTVFTDKPAGSSAQVLATVVSRLP